MPVAAARSAARTGRAAAVSRRAAPVRRVAATARSGRRLTLAAGQQPPEQSPQLGDTIAALRATPAPLGPRQCDPVQRAAVVPDRGLLIRAKGTPDDVDQAARDAPLEGSRERNQYGDDEKDES